MLDLNPDFVLFSNHTKEENGLLRYFPNLIQAYSKKKLYLDEVLSLSMDSVWSFFFAQLEFETICKAYSHIFKMEDSSSQAEGTLQAEHNREKKMIQRRYGWDFVAKEVADYTNTNLFDTEGFKPPNLYFKEIPKLVNDLQEALGDFVLQQIHQQIDIQPRQGGGNRIVIWKNQLKS